MLEKIICIEGLTCERNVPCEVKRFVPAGIEVAMGKRRAAASYMWIAESTLRRGF